MLSELASLPTVQYIRGLEEDVKRYREKLKEERRQKRELQVGGGGWRVVVVGGVCCWLLSVPLVDLPSCCHPYRL